MPPPLALPPPPNDTRFPETIVIWYQIFGYNVFGLRMLAVLFGMLGLPLIYVLARRPFVRQAPPEAAALNWIGAILWLSNPVSSGPWFLVGMAQAVGKVGEDQKLRLNAPPCVRQYV
jgi:hypothetical protein